MTDKELHRNTLIFAGVVIVALVIWAYVHNQVFGSGGSSVPSVSQAGEPVFVITGAGSPGGNISFPPAVYNIPDTPVNGTYNPGGCLCGCSGAGDENVTFSFPNMTGYFTALQQANNAAINAAFGLAVSAMPYDEGVTVANNTPTPFT